MCFTWIEDLLQNRLQNTFCSYILEAKPGLHGWLSLGVQYKANYKRNVDPKDKPIAFMGMDLDQIKLDSDKRFSFPFCRFAIGASLILG